MKFKQSKISWIGGVALGLAVLLCAGLLAAVGIVRGEESAQSGAAPITEYTVSFVQGNTGTTQLFANTQKTLTVDASGCITLPTTFNETVDVNDLGENRQLDCETFYFDTYDAAAVADGSLWAYTFTGWQIVGTEKRIAGETVLQPGFVIPPEVLEQYASDGTLELKALWGKCYFIQNPYQNMVSAYELITRYYPQKTTSNGVTEYSWRQTAKFIAVNTNKAGLIPTGAFDRKEVVVDSGSEGGEGGSEVQPDSGSEGGEGESESQPTENIQSQAETEPSESTGEGGNDGVDSGGAEPEPDDGVDSGGAEPEPDDGGSAGGGEPAPEPVTEVVWNKGNDPQNPLATVDYLYSLLGESGDPYDANEIAMVLTGDLDYVKDENAATYTNENKKTVNYSYTEADAQKAFEATGVSHPGPSTADTGWVDESGYFYRYNVTRTFGENDKAPGLTVKSLQQTEGQVHSFYIKHYNTACYLYSSLRFDNVKLDVRDDRTEGTEGKEPRQFMGKSLGNIIVAYDTARADWTDDTEQFFETTARMQRRATTSVSEHSPIGNLRIFKCERVVLCGGFLSNLILTWDDSAINEGRMYPWYVGGDARVGNVYVGLSDPDTERGVVADGYFIMTGGSINNLYGGSESLNGTNRGDRTYRIYGDGANRSPQVQRLFGGPLGAKMFGNVDILIKNCDKIGDVHGGGQNYTASVYGNISLRMENSTTREFESNGKTVATGMIYGGGLYGCCEDDPNTGEKEGNVTLHLSGCTVSDDIYGSGRGNSTSNEAGDTKNTGYTNKPANWSTPPTGFPVRNANGSITSAIFKRLAFSSGYDKQAKGIIWNNITETHFFSMASVNNVDITVHDSNVHAVYGGGTMAVVLGDTSIRVTGNSTVAGAIYGGGNGTEKVGTVTLYEPIPQEMYDAPEPIVSADGITADITTDGSMQALKVQDADGNWVEKDGANKTGDKGISLGAYSWSNESYLLGPEYNGIDRERGLIYTAYDVKTAGQVLGSTYVSVADTSTVTGRVYGGGNAGTVVGDATLSFSGNAVLKDYVYAGGNTGDVQGSTRVEIFGNATTAKSVYGGGNAGNVLGSSTVEISETPKINGSFVFGGGYQGLVTVNSTVDISGGTVSGYVYGGGSSGNVGADSQVRISGTATVNSGRIFGGCNEATVAGNAGVYITGGTVTGEVFGGGNESSSRVNGDSLVELTGTEGNPLQFKGSIVYGGGRLGSVTGTSQVRGTHVRFADITSSSTAYLIGGGYKGNVGAVDVALEDVVIPRASTYSSASSDVNKGAVYGGGNQASVLGDVNITFTDVRLDANFYGGGNAGTVGGDVNITATDLDIASGSSSDANKPEYTFYGGGRGEAAHVSGAVNITITDGEYDWIYGGGSYGDVGDVNMTLQQGATPKPTNDPAVGDTAASKGYYQPYVGWCLRGGGSRGAAEDVTVHIKGGTMRRNTHIGGARGRCLTTHTIVDGGLFEGNIFGGGDSGEVLGLCHMEINGMAMAKHSVFGGGDQPTSRVGQTLVEINAPELVFTGANNKIYGGGNRGWVCAGTVSKVMQETGTNTDVYTVVDATPVTFTGDGSSKVIINNGRLKSVFGGSNGGQSTTGSEQYKEPEGQSEFGNIMGSSQVIVNGGTLDTVYGGNNAGGTISEGTQLTVSGGTVNTVYGGCNAKGTVCGTVEVLLRGGRLTNRAYGGGNQADILEGTATQVRMIIKDTMDASKYGETSVAVYGGGNEADCLVPIYVEVSGSAKVCLLFGGGKSATCKNVDMRLLGGDLEGVWGAGDAKISLVQEDVNILVDGADIDFLRGGGNLGTTNGNVTVTMNSGSVSDRINGGGNKGTVEGDVHVSVSGGTVNNLYGGGDSGENEPATVKGNVLVEVSGGTVTAVYGGGNKQWATVEKDATVDISGGTVSGNVYGGGNAGPVLGNASVTVSGDATVGRNVYGGGNQGTVGKNSYLTISGNARLGTGGKYSAYGGGNQGEVAGDSFVTMDGGTVLYDLFGGGLSAPVANTHMDISGGTVSNSVYGGGQQGQVQSTDVAVSGAAVCKHIYGGGYQGPVLGNAAVAISGGTVTGEVCGGGYEAQVASTTLSISGTAKLQGQNDARVYGGGRGGNVTGDVTVSVTGGTVTPNLYGGGREGHVDGRTAVTVDGGVLSGNVYGGGREGTVSRTQVRILDDANIAGSVFGGGEGVTATVKGGTDVLVDMNYGFQVHETPIDTNHITPSGQVHSTLVATGDPEYGYIGGSVYGGGDLARVGDGTINTGGDKASNITVAGSVVNVSNGCIAGSVFGGGRGMPPKNVDYNFYMGAVFGYTQVTVNGGLIGGSVNSTGNVYGGGEQSRVYTVAGQGKACTVSIVETEDKKIAINGSVFGGGDRGESGVSNAAVPTVYGDVSVLIQGIKDHKPSNIYFLAGLDGRSVGGGVYGDGNLCLVAGDRQIKLLDFEPATNADGGAVKTFYSLQRADRATLENSAVVLLGAPDLVEEDDTGFYSINRIGHLSLEKGSVVKLDQVVKYLGGVSSDLHGDQQFIHDGNNGRTGTYTQTECRCDEELNTENHTCGCLKPLTNAVIEAYRNGQSITHEDGTVTTHTEEDKNVICVANGLYLEVLDEEGTYGPVTGLFTLQLLYANPGEGGGFVYGSIPDSTGDFICETESWTFSVKSDVTAENFSDLMETEDGGLFIRVKGKAFQRPEAYEPGQTYYTRNRIPGKYMDIIDDVGGKLANDAGYTYYYWYIGGPSVTYDVELTGYIGAAVEEFASNTTLPQHAAERVYVLYGAAVNEALAEAVGDDGDFTLVQRGSVSDQEIALELRLGSVSLGFLAVENGVWGIQKDGQFYSGYAGSGELADDNALIATSVNSINDRMTWVLHKADTVSTTVSGLEAYVDIDLFESQNGVPENVTTDGTAMLSYTVRVSIVRLMASQAMYHDNLRSYTGVATLSPIHITGNSCFTVEYQTRYVPAAYPKTDGDTMTWALTTAQNRYFMSEKGAYFTVDANGQMYNFSEGLSKDDLTPVNNGTSYEHKITKDVFSEHTSFSGVPIPKNTKITMVDLSGEVPTYYYYICAEDTGYIPLTAFRKMGSHTTVTDLQEKPAFMAAYEAQSLALQTERLLFVFDFEQAEKSTTERFTGSIQLAHLYQSVDILDYAKQNAAGEYQRSWPAITEYQFHGGETGVVGQTYTAAFEADSYGEKESAVLNVHVEEDVDWINTLFRENGFALKIQLLDEDGDPAAMPAGMYFEYKGQYYYPGPDSTYIAVPVYEFGDHEIILHNPRFSLADAVGGDTATFRVSYYSAPDALYYNAFDTQVKKDAAYTLTEMPVSSLQVLGAPTDDRILDPGEALEFTYTARNGEKVSVTVSKKVDGQYVQVDWDSVFDGAPQSLSAAEAKACSWALQSGVDAGTYRLIFTFGQCTEYMNLIVK